MKIIVGVALRGHPFFRNLNFGRISQPPRGGGHGVLPLQISFHTVCEARAKNETLRQWATAAP
jgi:hypothetical protein